MDKSAKHEARYYKWFSRATRYRVNKKRLKKRTKQKLRQNHKDAFLEKDSEYSRIHDVVMVMRKKLYEPTEETKPKGRMAQHRERLSFMLDKEGIASMWEQAKKIAL